MSDIILLALREEAPHLALKDNVFFTGVGKINAAATTAGLIERHHPDRIINFGTAGGITVGAGLHKASRFVQRDMRCTGLGFAPGQTPYENDVVLDLGDGGLTCSTGDDFVTDPTLEIPADLVDMEAYAMAKTCTRLGIKFLCYKFVSDRADQAAGQDWAEMVAAGEQHYINQLHSLGIL